jgi:hypothetical protein
LRLIQTALFARQFLLEDALAIGVAGLLRVFLNRGIPPAKDWRQRRRAWPWGAGSDESGYQRDRLAALVDARIRDQRAAIGIRAFVNRLRRCRQGKRKQEAGKRTACHRHPSS